MAVANFGEARVLVRPRDVLGVALVDGEGVVLVLERSGAAILRQSRPAEGIVTLGFRAGRGRVAETEGVGRRREVLAVLVSQSSLVVVVGEAIRSSSGDFATLGRLPGRSSRLLGSSEHAVATMPVIASAVKTVVVFIVILLVDPSDHFKQQHRSCIPPDAVEHDQVRPTVQSTAPEGALAPGAGPQPPPLHVAPKDEYRIFAGTDVDDNGFIGDDGEAFGAYPLANEPRAVSVSGNVTGIAFPVGLDFGIQSASFGRASAPERRVQRRGK